MLERYGDIEVMLIFSDTKLGSPILNSREAVRWSHTTGMRPDETKAKSIEESVIEWAQ